ncbi:MAG: hypothetical protein WCX65_00865 [bacterium]
MKKLMLITMMLMCFVQASAFAAETVKVNLQFEIPRYVRVEKKEHKIHKDHHNNNGQGKANFENKEDYNAVAELPEVESNGNWKVVVTKGKEVVSAGSELDSMSASAEKVAENMFGSRNASQDAKSDKQQNNVELAYTFFAD